ncbi:MAG: sensor histidine kinase [Ferruginibacter sp.]
MYTEGLNESIDKKNAETVLYRVLQECINNVIKHAGATSLDIALIGDETGINATIEDNGKGFHISDKKRNIPVSV